MTFLQLLQRLMSLAGLILLGVAAYLIWSWFQVQREAQAIDLRLHPDMWRLWWGLGLIAFSLLGRLVLPLALGSGGDKGRREAREGEHSIVPGADGSSIWVESYGPKGGPLLILTHGWGLDSTAWRDARLGLADRFRVVVWDLPGLGKSKPPSDRKITLDRFADDLNAVLQAVGAGRRAVLVGHSIGGMIVQTFCRRHPQALGREAAGLVLENTCPSNPIQYTALSGLMRVLQKPVLEPLMHLEIWLSPLVWLMKWHSYLQGSAHLGMRIAGFGTQPTRAQLDHMTRLAAKASPPIEAKGNLAMMHWDARATLPQINAPTLVIGGGRDLVLRPRASEQIAAAIPGAWYERIEDAGHMGPVERADAYNTAVANFATTVLADAVSADHPLRRPALAPRAERADQPNERTRPTI